MERLLFFKKLEFNHDVFNYSGFFLDIISETHKNTFEGDRFAINKRFYQVEKTPIKFS